MAHAGAPAARNDLPGNRVLVHSGPITSPILEETLTLKVEADGARLPATQRLHFHFEIDLD